MVYINELNEKLEKYNLKVSDTNYFKTANIFIDKHIKKNDNI